MERPLFHFPFPVTLQCGYDEKSTPESFEKLLAELSKLGFYGIELNLPDLRAMPCAALGSLLDRYGLRLTYVATGAFAMRNHLSLSSRDEAVRKASVNGCLQNIDYASHFRCGIIIGFLKRKPSEKAADSEPRLRRSLTRIALYARRQNVPVLLEATNRYESGVVNTVAEAVKIADGIKGGNVEVLPDTYHMNMEESHPLETLRASIGRYPNIHFSDDNRYFPGYGSIDFGAYIDCLRALHYSGTVGIEGRIKTDLPQDIGHTVNYLHGVLACLPGR